MIIVTVLRTHAAATVTEVLTAGRVGMEAKFHFSSEWDGLGKTAVFEAGSVTKDVIVDPDGILVPHECMIAGADLRVGVYGYDDSGEIVIPTIYALVGQVQRGADPSGDESYPPTPDVGEQAVAAASKALEAAAEAQEVAADIQRRADAGEFDGAQGPQGQDGAAGKDGVSCTHVWNGTTLTVTSASGTSSADLKGEKGDDGRAGADGQAGESGGYYTPTITQPENGKMRVGFIPSKSGMPTVVATEITLPGGSSVNIDSTLTQSGKAADAKAVGDRLLALENNTPAEGGSGLTVAQVNALDGMFKIASYTEDPTSAYAAFKAAFGIGDSGGGEEEPDEPVTPEVTLTSISATYSGGDVDAGTALTDLTGIVVTAHYSDGSTATVTDYSLSGEIMEGSNTITVSYGGKTATFTVTGVAESGGSDAVNLYSGQLAGTATNVNNLHMEGNTITYEPQAAGSLCNVTVEGLEADKEYTIFVESTRTDGGHQYTECRLYTENGWGQGTKLAQVYPSWSAAGKNYATFTANGNTLYLFFCDMGAEVTGASPTLSIYIYEGTLTERP